jgi:hypothetical protein
MKKTIVTSLITATLFLLCHTASAQTPVHTYESTHPIRFLAGGVGMPGGASPGYVKEECYVSFYNWPDTPIDFTEVSAWYFDEWGNMVDLGYATSFDQGTVYPSLVYEYPADITNLHYYWSVFYTDGTFEIQQIDYWDM